MIKDRGTTIGYHCPYCGLPIINSIDLFQMGGNNLIKIKCVCGSGELVVQALKDHKYRLTIPCILCPNSHSYTLSSNTFFKKDLFSFSCKFTAVNICFIGQASTVYDALKQNEEELMKIFNAFDEYNDEDFDDDEEDFDEDEDFDFEDDSEFRIYKSGDSKLEPKPEAVNLENTEDINLRSYQITEQILDIIYRMHEEKKIFCKCGTLNEGKIIVLPDAIRVECKKCGAYRDIKSSSISDADYLDGVEALYLDF